MPPRMPSTRIILGIEELDRRLEGMKLAIANRCARAGLTKGARLAAKLIKKQVPGSQKHIRKSIGSSVKKQKGGPNRGFTQAKAGAAVGRASKETGKAARGKRGGVGISAQNIHWYIMGTAERTVKKTGQRSGRMPANPIVQKAMASGKTQVIEAIKEGTLASIDRERMKLVAQYMVKHGN
jgi:hypothetical protein